ELRREAYARLASIANRWTEMVGGRDRFPDDLAAFVAFCAARGQRRPTPLLLRYTAGGYNCLHQDLYGAVAFPLQVTVPLTRPGIDFTAGGRLAAAHPARARAALAPGAEPGRCFPAPAHRPLEPARHRLHGRRDTARRATPARPVARAGDRAGPGPGRDLPQPLPAGRGDAA